MAHDRKRELAYIRLRARGISGRTAAKVAGYAHGHYSWALDRRLADEIALRRLQIARRRRAGPLPDHDAQALIDTVLSVAR